MKKIIITMLLMSILSLSIIAGDGNMGAGRSCPQGQTCLVSADQNAQMEQKSDKQWFFVLFESMKIIVFTKL